MAYGGKLRLRTPGVGSVRLKTGVGVTAGVGYAADCEAMAALRMNQLIGLSRNHLLTNLAEAASVALVTSKPSG